MEDKELSGSLAFLPPPASSKAKQINIALIDPRALIRESFSEMLKTNSQDFSVHTFKNITQFLKFTTFLNTSSSLTLKKRRNDDNKSELKLIVINIDAPEAGSDDAQKNVIKLRKLAPNIPLIVLTDQEDNKRISEAFRNGASGYLPTSLTPSIAIAAIRLIIAGGRYIPEAVISQILEGNVPHLQEHFLDNFDYSEILDDLTERQQEVLSLLRKGKSNKLIAYEIGVQESTVKVHVRDIMKKLHATNRTHAAYIADHVLSD